MSRSTRLLIALTAVLCVGAEPARGWGNKISHQDLFDASLDNEPEALALERFLREGLGISEGANVRLAVQLGFDARIDAEIGPAGGDGSRLTDNLNKGKEELNPADLKAVGVDIEVTLEAAPPCPRNAEFESCLEERRGRGSEPAKWLRLGTWAEDNPNPRSRHHFHDPVRLHEPPTGNHGLDNSKEFLLGLDAFMVEPVTATVRGGSWFHAAAGMLLFPLRTIPGIDVGNFDFEGRSAVDRALNTERGGSATSVATPGNLLSLADAERYLYAALRKSFADEREHYLALHFLAAGHGIHLLQDMTSVAHVRNDFINDHLYSPKVQGHRTLEDAGDDLLISRNVLDVLRGKGFESQPARFLREVPPPPPAAASDYLATVPPPLRDDFALRDLWDEIPFEIPDGGGLAEFTHRNFFSAGTVTNRTPPLGNGYEAPLVPSCETPQLNGPGSGPTWVAELPVRRIDSFEAKQPLERDLFISSPLVPHLARCRFHSLPFSSVPRPFRPWSATVHDESVQRDYLELLWPQTIHYTSKLMERYWAPRLEVVPLDATTATPAERERSFRLANLSLLPFVFPSDGIEVIFDGLDGERHRAAVSCGSGAQTLELEATPHPGTSGPASTFVCELPVALPAAERPANRGDFWIVARGALGERGVVAPAIDYDEGRADYVVAFDHVRGNELLYGGFTGDCGRSPLDPGADAACQLDVYALEIDPSRERAEPSVPRNLTESFRAQASSPERVDFSHPAPQPFGDMIALRSDLGTSLQSSPLAPQGLNHDVKLIELGPDASSSVLASVEVCEASVACRPSHGRLDQSWITWAPEADVLFFYENPWDGPSGLFRHDIASAVSIEVLQFEVNDPFPIEPLAGDEREDCSEAFAPLSARSASELAVMPLCRRITVTEVRGPHDYDTEILHKGWDIFSVVLTLDPSVSKMRNVPSKRVQMQPPQVMDCGVGPVCGETVDDDFEMFPVWSPDGRQLAFLRKLRVEGDLDDLVANNLGKELFVADVYTGGPTAIRKVLELGEDEGYIANPTWSPGGEWIAFTIWGPPPQDTLGEVHVVRTDGAGPQSPRRVTKGVRIANTLAWRATTPLLLP